MFRRIARRLRTLVRRRLVGDPIRPVILMYHRVGQVSPDPWRLAVQPANFNDQMQWLAQHRRVMSMQDFVDQHAAGTLPREAVAITFDDGYADNALEAQPVLKQVGLPATLFVVSGAIGRRQPFWWDTLARLILNGAGDCDASLSLDGEELPLRWRREDVAQADWHCDVPPPGPREAAYLAVWRKLQRASEEERQAAIQALRNILGDEDSPSDRAMDEAEFADLAKAGVFTVAGHSETHPALSALSPAEVEGELRHSFVFSRTVVPTGPVGFAYPYGDLNNAVREAVIAAGFAWACSTRRAALRADDDRFALPRLGVGDWSAAEMSREIATLSV
jgi:peptidoglycan/xylan/chitin deacetylase (PgdA/CDA1 family)